MSPNINRSQFLPVIALAGLLAQCSRGAAPLPPPPGGETPAGPAFADFVGAEACATCHAAQYDAWRISTHGKAGGPPTRERVVAPFNGQALRFRDARVTPAVAPSGSFIFTVAQNDRPVVTFEVAAVVGGGFMVGGGTQAFFARFPDGTLRFLPFDYSRSDRRWFCQLKGGRGWVPVSPAISLADCDAWPPQRVLGRSHEQSERFQTCQQCHGSQIEITLDSATNRYETRFTTLAINCESCHGPGRRHVAVMRGSGLGVRGSGLSSPTDIGIGSLATLSKDQSLEVCFQCHAVKTALEPGYLPGKPLAEHYAMKLPLLLDAIYFADGRTRVFAYQEGHLASDCYLNGSMTCVDCHDPHSQRYRDVSGAPLPGRFDDGQCLGCHPSKAEPLERHTHHPRASAGSRCVSCHMPYLQQPNVGSRTRYARSDHAIPIPRPAFDTRLGVETACRQCHRDLTVEQLDREVAAWYGEVKPHPPAITAVLAAERASDPAAAARLILDAGTRPPSPDRERGTGGEVPGTGRGGTDHPWAKFAGLAQVLERFIRPDMAVLDRQTIDQLEQRARSADADIQAQALATLHLARGTDPGVRRFLARQLRGLGPRDRIVRSRWVWILRVRGDEYLARGDYENALAAYRKALELDPGDAELLRNIGVVYTRLADYSVAVEHFRQSLAQDSGNSQALVGLGFTLMQLGDLDGAIAAHRRAIAAGPWDPAGYANLGVAYLRRNEARPAIEALEQAVSLDPGLSAAHFVLADAYARGGRRADAELALRRGLEFDPRNAQARRMLEALRR